MAVLERILWGYFLKHVFFCCRANGKYVLPKYAKDTRSRGVCFRTRSATSKMFAWRKHPFWKLMDYIIAGCD